MSTLEAKERLFKRSVVIGECLIFVGSLDSNGYGNFWFQGRLLKAHRASYIFNIGNISEDKFVLHKCDNRACINPPHLFLGTQLENVQDMFSKGRQHDRKGIANGNAVLSLNDLDQVRQLLEEGYLTQAEIGQIFNVAQTTISYIKRRDIG